MFEEIDTTNAKTIDAQLKSLQSIADELITIDKTGVAHPKPGVTKEQMLYAIEQISHIASIYEERVNAHLQLQKESRELQKTATEVGNLAEKINKKYGGKIYPEWFMKLFKRG
jgi:ribosomal protein L17